MAAVERQADVETEPSYIVTGYATTFDDPYVMFYKDGTYYEVVDRHAFDDCDMTDVIMQFDHEGRVFARTRNNTLTVVPDEHGLLITADLGSTTTSRELYEDIKAGLIDRMSFGFTIEDDVFDRATNTSTIKRIGKLYDVSAVSIPANPGTDISARMRRTLDGQIERRRLEQAAQERIEMRKRLLQLKLKMIEVKAND